MTKLRAYMAYDRLAGSEEGAVLVFAYDAREARKLAWPHMRGFWDCQWIDTTVRWLRSDCAHMRRQDTPHVVESPPTCEDCEQWYSEPYDDEGCCEACAEAREWNREGTMSGCGVERDEGT